MKIKDTGLSELVKSYCESNGLVTVDQLIEEFDSGVMSKHRHLGKKSLWEIECFTIWVKLHDVTGTPRKYITWGK